MRQILSSGFVYLFVALAAMPLAHAGAETSGDPLDSQGYSINSGGSGCPIGTHAQSVVDNQGTFVGTTCTIDGTSAGSSSNEPIMRELNHTLNDGSDHCGANGWTQGVMDWRGEFRGTICNYPSNSGGKN